MKINLYQSLRLEDVIDTKPPTVDSQVEVIDALTMMNQRNQDSQTEQRYSYVLVTEKSQLVGILTERDIVKLTSTQIDIKGIKVNEVMTKKLITLKKSEFLNIDIILSILRQKKIRHIPIVDEQGQLEGIVTVNTITQALHPSDLLKFRRVSEAITVAVPSAHTTASVLELSQIMAEAQASCVVIVSEQKLTNQSNSHSLSTPIGIVTERDVVQFQIMGLDFVNTVAQDIMSTPLVCVKMTDSLMEVRQKMAKLRVRRLVAVGDRGELQGVINQYDILKVLDPTELYSVIETLQSELSHKTSQLQKAEELAQVTLQSIGDAVITTDDYGHIVNLNPAAERLTGWKITEARNKPLAAVFHLINEQTRETIADVINKVLHKNHKFQLDSHEVLISRNGKEYAIEKSATLINDRQGQVMGIVIIFRDVTEYRNLTHQLSWQASHDPLTGLYNRREFENRLGEAIASAQNEEHQHALCYLDLDRFKIVNDTCGHAAGDQLLKQITQLLSQQIRSADILARLGGDEFGFLLYQCPLDVASKIANNLRQWIEDFRFTWKKQTFAIGVSIGIVEITSSSNSIEGLLNAADAACYVAKANGRNCFHIYQDNDVELSKNLGERQWIARLNQALVEDRFCLYVQKIVSIKNSTEKDRYEILLRLQDQTGKLIAPGVFIPAAERYNLMPAIDRWVVSHFFANYELYCQENQNSAMANAIYAINLSGTSISSKMFRHFLKEQFARFKIAPETICFEITETAAISNLAIAEKFIRELKQLGCLIALDDFGSGMSSLNYLKNLSVDYLKIDGSFVKNIVSDRLDLATVEYFNHIAQIMKIKTVAEFVEDRAILRKLEEIEVNYAQGYGIERPKPLVFARVS